MISVALCLKRTGLHAEKRSPTSSPAHGRRMMELDSVPSEETIALYAHDPAAQAKAETIKDRSGNAGCGGA